MDSLFPRLTFCFCFCFSIVFIYLHHSFCLYMFFHSILTAVFCDGKLGVIISPFQNGEMGIPHRYAPLARGQIFWQEVQFSIWDLKDHLILGVRFFIFQLCIYIYNNIYTVMPFSIVAPVPFILYFFHCRYLPHHF